MGYKLGVDAKLYVNTGTFAAPVWSELTNARDVTVPLEASEAVRNETAELEAAVAAGETTPALAAERLLKAFGLGG